ncbi:MAG: cation:proton antiporter [Gemmatimonadota bacterium]
MNPLVGALVLILLGLLGARLSFAEARVPLGPRLIISSGTHFLFLGFLLGSHALALFPRDVIDQLYPFLALGLGWIGFLFGLQLDRRHLRRFPRRYLAIALLQAVLAFLLFLGFGLLVLGTEVGLDHRVALLTAAATACISTPAAIGLISSTFHVKGRVSRLLFFIASLDAVVGILALQLTYAFHRGPVLATAFDATVGLDWITAAVLLGVVSGILFLWLTRPRPGREEIVLFLLGVVVFASGAALHLGLSPLFVSAVAGAVVANLSPLRRRIYALLQTWEQPVYVILLILAGALLDFPSWLVVPLALGYLLVRALAKIIAGYAATRVIRPAFTAPADLGAGLIPQGGISLAMAVSVVLTYGAMELDGLVLPDVVFSTVVLGVVASELVGPILTRGLLRRTGEIHPRVEPEGADRDVSSEPSGHTHAASIRRGP